MAKYHVNRSPSEEEAKEQKQWNPYLAAQNLPAVLNDPSRGKQTNFFTKKWGDSFVEKTPINTSPHLEAIAWADFDVYLKRIGRRYKRHQRLEQSLIERQLATNSSTISSPSSSVKTVASHPGYAESDLRDIPGIFFKTQLALNEPATFGAVFPGLGGGPSDEGGAQQQSGRLLQEKLSHYLDIVEVQIARQVSEKSSAFFHAMTSQDTIMEKMSEAAHNVKVLREGLRNVDQTMVKESFRVMQLQRSRENYQSVLEKLRLMATVHQTQPMIQLLLGTQDYVAALDLIGTTQEICAQELVGIHCFRHLPSQLLEMERLIDKMLTTDFEKYATADLNRPWTASEQRVQEEEKLVSIISGLLRKKNFAFVDTYKEEAVTTIKAMIKQMVIEVIAASDDEVCLTGHGEESQSNLSLADWIVLLEAATGTLSKLLTRIRAVHDVMEQINDASAGKVVNGISFFDSEAFLAEEDHKLVATRLKDLLQSVCNYCHDRCSKLVSAQSLERSTATAEQIQRLSEIVVDFTGLCESICGGPITGVLKVAVTAQGVKFAQKFHGERKSKLALLLDTERWKQADVPTEFQRIIDCISQGSFAWDKDLHRIGMNGVNGHHEVPMNGGGQGGERKATPASAVLIVDGEPFALVGAALLLVQICSEYCRCASQLPLIAVQLSRNVVDLLRTFNSRCCQLVLGAGALHTAGLKTITSGNLALVSRALQLVMWLLPHVRTHFQAVTGGGAAAGTLMGYETVEKDFQSHIGEIEGKVLAIVSSLVVTQMAGWDARPPVPSQPFRSISRHFVKLHEAIAPILPERQVHSIYRTVNLNFKDKLREQLLRYNIVNNGGPQHGVVTAELTFYLETLRTLKAMPKEELGDEQMEDIWLK